ncbi:BON domain-containing protein [Undibacterium sp. Tian12W]|uniref:BON domain-containing protein n=1 Tax=Undibacterium sp. Tian12W TaxID=3413054 RepID=UPI003BF1DC03
MKTDAKLKEDVNAELQWEPSINAARIGVEVKDGIVTLAGHVDSYSEKLEVERATQRVTGVKALAVEIEIDLPGTSHRHDRDIAATAQNVLGWMSILPYGSVKIMVENGWITLSGEVDWEFQKVAAVVAVRYLMGVRGVSDDIQIKSKVSPGVVKSEIEAALKRSAMDDAKKINVVVDNANVTLSGKVGNWAERESARHAAWGTPGVKKVVDNMTLSY